MTIWILLCFVIKLPIPLSILYVLSLLFPYKYDYLLYSFRYLIVFPDTISVVSNITQDSLVYSTVYHNLSSVQRPEILTYNLTLHINGTTETLSNVPISQVNSTAFSNKFLLDTYYRISVSAINCTGGSGSVFSKTFVLLGYYRFPKFLTFF